MSIIVKGMEMPKNCTRCDYIGLNAAIGCSVMSGTNGRATDCPLVALPDNHGRLVDADALIADCQLAQKQADRHGREFANAFYSGGGEVSTEWWCVEDMIENAPTIEPQQRWIPCSERLPENRVDVLICYREWQKYAKRYVYTIVNGWYARKYSVKENVFSEWEMDSDYKEDEDEFYIPEGWYEFTTQGNGDLMNWFINAEVIAWMPLPELYREEGD